MPGARVPAVPGRSAYHACVTRTEQLRDRLLGAPIGQPVLGWAGPLLFAVLGGLLRFWRLDRPHQLVFDETYYVKQGVSMLEYGVEMRWRGEGKIVDPLFTHGNLDVFITDNGDMVVHPPVGKWVIAVGEWIFGGTSSWGWRFSVCALGTLSILMIGRIARRLFRSSLLGTIAAFLTAFEGHHFVQSRTGLLDLILMFVVLSAFGALLIDRDNARERLAAHVGRLSVHTYETWGPVLGFRPWRWVAGVCLGLATGTKWSGLFFLIGFGLMTVLWDMGAYRAAGVRRWVASTFLVQAPIAALVMVGLTLVTYLTSWTGWFLSADGYKRHWAETHPSSHTWIPAALRSLWSYHVEAYHFHQTLTSPHDYMSNPWAWMVQARPTSFFYEGPKKGQDGCTVTECSKAISSVGTITIWWLATIGIFFLVYHWVARRDWRAGAILCGLAAGWLPWFDLQHRTIFQFYAIAFQPWVVLSAVFVLGLILGKATDSPRRRRLGLLLVGGYCLVTLALFAFYWPIYTAQVIPYDSWRLRMWFPSWI
ncbi:MAG: phospholipid carrier-dependent glycosyltransferase [Tetrasphaera sp.]|nr:phospholipid carrier-dependent glycosyltransferase [Tetrasphaera sp.]